MSRDHNARSRLLRYIFGIQIPTVQPTFNVQGKKVRKKPDFKQITSLFRKRKIKPLDYTSCKGL